MNYAETLAFIHGQKAHSARPGLHRIRELMGLLGDPQEQLKCVHIAGTNGKGSTAAMLTETLRAAGYRTGCYTSPYIYDFRERFQVDGELIPEERLAALGTRVREACKSLSEPPTEFEIVTAIGFLFFAEEHCDVVVLETGLGGRFDATNVITCPLASVICSISLDHMAYLGNTVEQIAFEKCGIVKPGRPLVWNSQNTPETTEVAKRICLERNAPFYPSEQGKNYTLSLQGAHQQCNAAVAVETVQVLREQGYKITDEQLRTGLYRAYQPARMEQICENPPVFVDGGHNQEGIDVLVRELSSNPLLREPVIIFGMMQDKPYQYAIQKLALRARAFLCVAPDVPRAMAPKDLQEIASVYCDKTYVCASLAEAAAQAKALGGPVLAAGSLYLAGGITKELKKVFGS